MVAAALALTAGLWCCAPAPLDEPPTLSNVYREKLRVTLVQAAEPGRAGLIAAGEFRSLAAGHHPAVAHALARMLTGADTPRDRTAAARGLGLLRRVVDAAPLADALTTERDPDVRAGICQALGQVGGELARHVLTRAARGGAETPMSTRLAALEALYATGHPAAPALLAELASGELPPLLRPALEAARQRLQLTETEWATLGTTVDDTAPEARRLRAPATGAALAAVLADTSAEAEAQREARRAVRLREFLLAGDAARFHDTVIDSVPELLAQLDDGDAEIRAGARRMLHRLAGQDLGPEPTPWRAWWRRVRPTLRITPALLAGE